MNEMRDHARRIWHAAVDAVRPAVLMRRVLADLAEPLRKAPRIWVLGAGKAGAAMAAAAEEALADQLDRIDGIVNVPGDATGALRSSARRIRLNVARPTGTNFPTAAGVTGAEEMLRIARNAGPDDIALCLLSGGGSALLPAPVEGVTLADKLVVTKALHECGATINDMNAVRKHLSAIKGGRLAQAFAGKAIYSLIISDVVGDPLDVIASGPTAPDSSTFADALAVLEGFGLRAKVPASILAHLQKGRDRQIADTPKSLPASVRNLVIGNNAVALAAAHKEAEALGYRVCNLGSFIEGETRHVATVHVGIVKSAIADSLPSARPICLLSGGETTATLAKNPGKGGRNQEFVLAALLKLGRAPNVAILSGGTDGEDGPTDAAGAIGDQTTFARAHSLGLNAADYLERNDAYHFFEATGDLFITGLTQTNVMDVRMILAR